MKVWDCCILSTELDMLDLRLKELQDVVDYHVVVEASHTFTGVEKPMHFWQHRERFKDFMHKIVYVTVFDMPTFQNRWEAEYFQRNAIGRGLISTEPADLVLISDADEIPKPQAVRWLKQQGRGMLHLKTYYYNLCSVSRQYLLGTVAMTFRDGLQPQDLRNARHNSAFPMPVYNEGAWHFSFFGGVEAIVRKIHTFAHGEYDTPDYTNTDRVAERVVGGIDPFDRAEYPLTFEAINPSLPETVLHNLEFYRSWIPQTEQGRLGLSQPFSVTSVPI